MPMRLGETVLLDDRHDAGGLEEVGHSHNILSVMVGPIVDGPLKEQRAVSISISEEGNRRENFLNLVVSRATWKSLADEIAEALEERHGGTEIAA